MKRYTTWNHITDELATMIVAALTLVNTVAFAAYGMAHLLQRSLNQVNSAVRWLSRLTNLHKIAGFYVDLLYDSQSNHR